MSELVRIENLIFRYQKAGPVVLDIDRFSMREGERVFLRGPSGSGKSTLLNLIGGVLEPTEGEITVLGSLLGELGASARDRLRGDEMGFVFQQFNLIPYLSVLENVLLPLSFSSLKRERLEEAGGNVRDEALRLLRDLRIGEGLLGRPVSQLSVGQQQRVACARALMGKPALMIADEPTSSLDADTREAFLRLLFEECTKTKTALLFVSHDSSLGRMFEREVDLLKLNRAASAAEVFV